MYGSALIDLVRQHPFLYDKDHKDNTNYRKKETTWSEIGAQLTITGKKAHHHWRSLRDRYLYLRKYQNEPSKSSPNNKEGSSYKYFDKLSFLDEYFFVDNAKKRSNSNKTIPKGWCKEHTLILLRELRKNYLLYDKGHPYYLNRAQRHGALLKLAAKLKPYKPNLTPALIAHKIRIIRTQYSKEKRLIRNLATYEPKLWCYDILSFLDEKGTYEAIPPHAPTLEETERQLPDEVEYEAQESEIVLPDEEYVFDDESTIPFEEMEVVNQEQPQTVGYDGARDVLRSKCSRLLECLTEEMKVIETANSNEGLDCSIQSQQNLLGLLVESELANVSEEIYLDTKWKIIRVLEEAARSTLKEKQHPVQNNLQSTSVSTTSLKPAYNLRLERKPTSHDDFIYETACEDQRAYNNRQSKYK